MPTSGVLLRAMSAAAVTALAATVAPPAMADDAPIQLPLVQDVPPSPAYEGRASDVLGVRFGDTRDEVLAKLKAAYPSARIEERTQENAVRDRRGVGVVFDYTWAIEVSKSEEPRERMVVRFTTAATGGRVFGITRTITYDDQPAAMTAVKDSIAQKYGRATMVELYPHQNRDEITYTWEKTPIRYLPPADISKPGVRSASGGCATEATDTAYDTANSPSGMARYTFTGSPRGDETMANCIGGIAFNVFYGQTPNVVRELVVEAVDYQRTLKDALVADQLLTKLQQDKVRAIQGGGAPRL